MKKTNLDKLIEQEIKNDSSLESRLNREGQAINIAIQIYSLRKQKNLTQAQLANLAHVRQSNISRLENAGYEGYSKKTLEKIAKSLGVDLAIFLIPKENINNVNTLLEIANKNQTNYAIFPGAGSNWVATRASISGLIIEEKDEFKNEVVPISGNSGGLKVIEHFFNFV